MRPRGRKIQRRRPPNLLAFHAERLSTGGEQPQLRALRQQPPRGSRHPLQKMLAVVQHEQLPARGEHSGRTFQVIKVAILQAADRL